MSVGSSGPVRTAARFGRFLVTAVVACAIVAAFTVSAQGVPPTVKVRLSTPAFYPSSSPVVSADRAVWCSGARVVSFDFATGARSVIATIPGATEVAVDGDDVAVVAGETDEFGDGGVRVFLVDAVSGVVTTLTPDAAPRSQVRVSGGLVVWVEGATTRKVAVYDTSASTLTFIATGSVSDPAVHGTRVAYWSDRQIVVYDMATSSEVWRTSNAVAYPALALGDHDVSWIDYTAAGDWGDGQVPNVRVHDVDSSVDSTIVVPSALDIAADGEQIFWLSDDDWIMTSNVSGAATESTRVIVTGQVSGPEADMPYVYGLAAGGHHLAWGTQGDFADEAFATFAGTSTVVSLKADKSTVTYGAKTYLRGKITPAAGAALVLQRAFHYRDQWEDVRTITTAADGSFAVATPGMTDLWYYRVIFAGTNTLGYSMSPAAAVKPYAKVGRPAVPKRVYRNHTFSATGSIAPVWSLGGAHPKDVKLYVERKVGRHWKSAGSAVWARLYFDSHDNVYYKGSLKATHRGAYRVRAYGPSILLRGAAYSSYRTFTVH